MNLLLICLSFFILFFIIIFIIQSIKISKLSTKPKNNVHFYVARDKNKELWLYMGKPIRYNYLFKGDLDKNIICLTSIDHICFGLNENDYADLKWEDEPIEVFLNLED